MIITRLNVNYFGKFSGKEIELKPGINLIYGENEAGKTTLHTFIKGMLFGIERLRGRGASSKEDTYMRYLPWDYPGAYGGQMDIMLDDRVYRLQRSFHANEKSFIILDLLTGREIKLKEDHISELIPGLTESAFRNTISIEQLRAETDSELASHVKNYITNLSIAKSREVNVEKALSSLKEKKKALESLPYAAQLKSLSEKIKDGEAKEVKIDLLTAKLKELESKEKDLVKQSSKHKNAITQKEEKLMGELPAILEKYRSYRELTRQYSQINSQVDDQKDKLTKYQKYLVDLDNKQEDTIKGARKKGLTYIVSSLVVCLLSLYLSKAFIVGAAVLGVALIVGVMLLTLANKKRHRTNKEEYLRIDLSLKHGKELLKELTERRKKLEDSCDVLSDSIMLYMQEFISEDELTPEAVDRLQEVIRLKKSEAFKEQSEHSKKLEELRFQIGKIGWELSDLEENETELIKNKEQYAYIMQKQVENEAELKAINLALTTINELSATIHDSFGLELNKAVSEIIDSVTDHRYNDIKIDEKLNIKLGWNDNYIILDRLSAGTIDQVYFALRLATSDLLIGKEPMPLILDDSFALYDDSRMKAALTMIADYNQVIMFSCQKRERQILEDLKIPFNYIEL
ncbi:MAG: hypothetical protein EWM47_08090 [Anaerolineaceae bacterium]|nr:MAG: hypothetical protein EWM47_08090 [Anaerolineaceae bacterium]